jgi:hypothetical protein
MIFLVGFNGQAFLNRILSCSSFARMETHNVGSRCLNGRGGNADPAVSEFMADGIAKTARAVKE